MTSRQWIGLCVTLAVVAGVHLCVYLTRGRLSATSEPAQLVMLPEYEEAFLRYADSAEHAEREKRYASYRYTRRETHLQPFDPNTADSILLVTVGLKPYMAKNLIRYRQAGKIFRRPEDFRTLYGMTDSLFATLKPYIQIDSAIVHTLDSLHRSVFESTAGDSIGFAPYHPKRDTVIELNSADTASLQFIRGIGRYTAVCIVQYRSRLGGFVSPQQLREITEIPADRVDSMIASFTVDTSLITPIEVNHASVKRLYRHPYISYRQAEQLYDLRRRRIRLQGLGELSDIFTADELARLAPYLRFD